MALFRVAEPIAGNDSFVDGRSVYEQENEQSRVFDAANSRVFYDDSDNDIHNPSAGRFANVAGCRKYLCGNFCGAVLNAIFEDVPPEFQIKREI